MTPKSIQLVINHLSELPGIGPRQAARIVFHLLKLPKHTVERLTHDISALKEKIRVCPVCLAGFEEEGDSKTCAICANVKRIKTTMCVVERESDIDPIEKTGIYKGTYHVVGENIDVLEGAIAPSINKLLDRITYIKKQLPSEKQKSMEIVIAMNATVEGDAIALYLTKLIIPLGVAVHRLGRGLASGAELEYADQQTLINALENRK
ncbi:MAG: recombination mediator RecR [Candidatus Azambacteria bacterium]|nr:recombination mediator RecR [Candidatus Azambacteria bacterium]